MTYPKKKKRQQTTLERLLFGRKFGFYAPYPIEECAALLLARSEREPGTWGNPNKLLVTVKQEHPGFYLFRLHRDAGRNLHAEVIGTLTRQEDSTLVEGKGRIGLFTLTFTVLAAVFVLPFLVAIILGGVPELAMFPIFVMGSLLLATGIERERLCKLTGEILGKHKEK
jgi:hypothetical protein